MTPIEPDQTSRITQAIIQKATRVLLLTEAPLGLWGTDSEFGSAVVRPDYQTRELLFGLHGLEPESLAGLVESSDVIRAGLGLDPTTFPTERVGDVDRAVVAATDWVESELFDWVGLA